MALDVLTLGGQLRQMSELLRIDLRRLPDQLTAAWELLVQESDEWEFWSQAVIDARPENPPLLARPLEPMDLIVNLPPCASAYAIAGTDGSQIEVEYGGLRACYVVNVGTVTLCYGEHAGFEASTRPTLGFQPDELVIEDQRTGRIYPVEGPVLAAERDLREGLALAEVALSLADDRPRLGLQDGTLIRWSLMTLDDFLRNRFLGDYLSYLETMRTLPCPVVSYMSQPRARDVINLVQFLRVKGDMARWQKTRRPADDPFGGVLDHLIYNSRLSDGQRSAVWASESRINVELYGPHLILFCYLKVGREVARIEFPEWVLESGYLDLVHALVYDQARRGLGYPVVLQRAHEQAVIHDDDRRQLEAVVERLLAQSGADAHRPAKQDTKLRPRV